MTIPGQMSLGAAMPEVPLIYVATPLSHLSPTERTDIISWCEVIDRRAVDAALTDVSPWLVRVHIPSQWSAPWNEDNMTPQEVYALNSTTVYEAAALVVVGYRGGSLGAGQEFAWATGARIPILYLRCQGEPVSRQLQGTPADIIVAEFDNENQLADHIVSFVRSRRSAIENHPQRLRTQAATLAHIVAAMQDVWSNLDPTSQGRAIAESRLVEPRIKELIDNPHALAAAALNEVSALAGALGVDLPRELSGQPLPELENREVSALRVVASENRWSGSLVVDLWKAAQLERLRPGIRRFRLHAPEDWERFRQRLYGDTE